MSPRSAQTLTILSSRLQPMVQTPDVDEDEAAKAAAEARASASRLGAKMSALAAPSTTLQPKEIAARIKRTTDAAGVDLPSPSDLRSGCSRSLPVRAAQGWGLSSPFTTLEAALRACPHGLGFDVELKYPSPTEAATHGLAAPERGAFVDSVIEVCGRAAGTRPLCFSTFDPDTARIARRKQVHWQGGAEVGAPQSLYGRAHC